MSTEDDLRPFGQGGRISYTAAAKVVAKVVLILAPAVGALWGAVYQASSETRARVQHSKDLAEAGYQATRHAVEEILSRLQVIEAREKARDAEDAAKAKRTAPHQMRRTVPTPQVPPVTPKALPSNLDTASAALRSTATVRPAPTPDGGQ